ncbi:MAG: cytochrome c [Acidobacteriota bacterium]
MKGRLVGILALALAARATGAARTSSRPPPDGFYSADQAKRGKIRYTTSCAACHQGDLSGTLSGDTGAPPLRGEPFKAFIQGWDARRLFDYVKATMPADDPSTLTDDGYLDILAYLFQVNDLPAGSQELGLAQLAQIRLSEVKQ